MSHITRVPADEFAKHAGEYLERRETVSIEKDGEVIGRYVPEPNGRSANDTAWRAPATKDAQLRRLEEGIDPATLARIRRLDSLLENILEESGMTEEEFAAYFDMTRPFPHDRDAEP